MPDPEATANEWTLEGIPVKTRHGRAVPSGCWPVQGQGSYIQPGERVVVARPEDTARKIAEGLRERAKSTKSEALGLVRAVHEGDAAWVEREFGGSG